MKYLFSEQTRIKNLLNLSVVFFLAIFSKLAFAAGPGRVFYNGKIVCVDTEFSVHSALAVSEEGKIMTVGSDEKILALADEKTERVDLAGKTMIPGLIDSHTHPLGAAMTEFDHPLPPMESIADVLSYVRARAKILGPGKWITLRQVFITRLREQRYPTRAELDEAAPENPVVFSTGPDAMANSLALKESGIDKDFQVTGNGYLEKDPVTGELTGMLRSCSQYLKIQSTQRSAGEEEQLARLEELLHRYNSVGLTGIVERSCSRQSLDYFQALKLSSRLTTRVAVSMGVNGQSPIEKSEEAIRGIGADPLRAKDPWVRIVGIKCFLDGGMLTGSAYMRKPWGVSKIYSIRDPEYRGLLYIQPEVLDRLVRAAAAEGLQFTAHSVGDGAVHALLESYSRVNQQTPLAATRPCLTHSNFMSAEAIALAAKLGVVVDIQPAWLYLDSHTLKAQFGYDRLRYFQPLKSLFAAGVTVGGGSDHMQKMDPRGSVNPYDPWLGMWTAVTRRGKYLEGQMHPEEALDRRQVLQYYTINNARLMFLEDQTGSLEPGKWADLVIVDRDILECPVDDFRETQVLQTWVGGKKVFEKR